MKAPLSVEQYIHILVPPPHAMMLGTFLNVNMVKKEKDSTFKITTIGLKCLESLVRRRIDAIDR